MKLLGQELHLFRRRQYPEPGGDARVFPQDTAAFHECLTKMAELKMMLRCARKQNRKALKRIKLAHKNLNAAWQ